jgi:hypothetical protein
MFLSFLVRPRNIINYVPRFVDAHKLHMSVFKPKNVFLNMNIEPEKHKKTEQMHFFYSARMTHRSKAKYYITVEK